MQFKVKIPDPPAGATKQTLKVGWLQESASRDLTLKDRSASIDVPDGVPFSVSVKYGDQEGSNIRQSFSATGAALGKGPLTVTAGKTAEPKAEPKPEAPADAGK